MGYRMCLKGEEIIIFTSENAGGGWCQTHTGGQSPTENEPGTDHDPSWNLESPPKYTVRPPSPSRVIPTPPFSFISYRKTAREYYNKPAKKIGGLGGRTVYFGKTGPRAAGEITKILTWNFWTSQSPRDGLVHRQTPLNSRDRQKCPDLCMPSSTIFPEECTINPDFHARVLPCISRAAA
jgi:hypothetical protein